MSEYSQQQKPVFHIEVQSVVVSNLVLTIVARRRGKNETSYEDHNIGFRMVINH